MTNLMMPINISSIDIQGADIVCRDSETIRVRAGESGAKLSIQLSDGRQKDGTDWNGAKYLVMDLCPFGHIETPDQTERGKAYQYYTEAAISTPVCVGAHYFTWNDQGAIGRPDGECFPHGLVDVCQQPYQAFVDGIVKTTGHLYEVASGAEAPTEEKGKIELALFA